MCVDSVAEVRRSAAEHLGALAQMCSESNHAAAQARYLKLFEALHADDARSVRLAAMGCLGVLIASCVPPPPFEGLDALDAEYWLPQLVLQPIPLLRRDPGLAAATRRTARLRPAPPSPQAGERRRSREARAPILVGGGPYPLLEAQLSSPAHDSSLAYSQQRAQEWGTALPQLPLDLNPQTPADMSGGHSGGDVVLDAFLPEDGDRLKEFALLPHDKVWDAYAAKLEESQQVRAERQEARKQKESGQSNKGSSEGNVASTSTSKATPSTTDGNTSSSDGDTAQSPPSPSSSSSSSSSAATTPTDPKLIKPQDDEGDDDEDGVTTNTSTTTTTTPTSSVATNARPPSALLPQDGHSGGAKAADRPTMRAAKSTSLPQQPSDEVNSPALDAVDDEVIDNAATDKNERRQSGGGMLPDFRKGLVFGQRLAHEREALHGRRVQRTLERPRTDHSEVCTYVPVCVCACLCVTVCVPVCVSASAVRADFCVRFLCLAVLRAIPALQHTYAALMYTAVFSSSSPSRTSPPPPPISVSRSSAISAAQCPTTCWRRSSSWRK